jgi:hypothetical protein
MKTPGNIFKSLASVRGKRFTVDGRRAYRMTAAVFMALGLAVFGLGLGAERAGSIARFHYERGAGKLVRVFSSRDRALYNRLHLARSCGRFLELLGILAAVFGAAAAIEPALLLYVLTAAGIGKQPGNDSSLPET